jgi:hypothetical protein
MANLPLNNTYTSPGPLTSTGGAGKISSTTAQNVLKGISSTPLGSLTPPMSGIDATSYMDALRSANSLPAGEALLSGKNRSPIPEGYGTFDPRFGQPTESTRLINFGGGQMVTDPSQPGTLFRTQRPDYDRDEWIRRNSPLLGGRSSSHWEVDHIVPLWAGGADNFANLQVITKYEHERKTNAQAVALTLRASGKISLTEARILAANWDKKDLTIVPRRDSKTGMIPLEEAQKVYNTWKKQEEKGIYIENGRPMGSIKTIFSPGVLRSVFNRNDFSSSMAHGAANVGSFIANPAVPGHKVLDPLIQGFASGFTGGWVPMTREDYTTAQKALAFGGALGGMLLVVGKIARALGVPAHAIKGAKTASTAAKTSEAVALSAKAANIAKKVKGMEFSAGAVAGAAKSLAGKAFQTVRHPIKSGVPKHLSDIDKKVWTALRTNRIVGYGAAFAIYGQMGREGLLARGAEKAGLAEDGVAAPMRRLMEDVVYGGVTGYASPTLKGAGLVMMTPWLLKSMEQGFSDGYQDGDTSWMEEALLMSIVMGGLHYATARGTPWLVREYQGARLEQIRRFEAQLEKAKTQDIESIGELASRYLREFSDQVPFDPKTGLPFPRQHPTYTSTDWGAIQSDIESRIWRAFTGERTPGPFTTLSPKTGSPVVSGLEGLQYAQVEQAFRRITATRSATEVMRRRALTLDQEDALAVKDAYAMFERVLQVPPGTLAKSLRPDGLYPRPVNLVLREVDDNIVRGLPTLETDQVGRLVGQGINPTVAANQRLVAKAIEGGNFVTEGPYKDYEVARSILLVMRPEMAILGRAINQRIARELARGEKPSMRPIENPDNWVEAYAFLRQPTTGTVQPLYIGSPAQKPTIGKPALSDGGYQYAHNKQPEIQEYLRTAGQKGKSPYDDLFNVDNIAERARSEGNLLFVMATLDTQRVASVTKRSLREIKEGAPILHFRMGDPHWSHSTEMHKRLGVQAKPIELSIKEAQLAAKEFSEKIHVSADDAFAAAARVPGTNAFPTTDLGKQMEMYHGYLVAVRNAMEGGRRGDKFAIPDIQKSWKANLKVELNTEEAAFIAGKGRKVLLGEVWGTLKQAASEGRMEPAALNHFTRNIIGFQRTREFQAWANSVSPTGDRFSFDTAYVLGRAARQGQQPRPRTDDVDVDFGFPAPRVKVTDRNAERKARIEREQAAKKPPEVKVEATPQKGEVAVKATPKKSPEVKVETTPQKGEVAVKATPKKSPEVKVETTPQKGEVAVKATPKKSPEVKVETAARKGETELIVAPPKKKDPVFDSLKAKAPEQKGTLSKKKRPSAREVAERTSKRVSSYFSKNLKPMSKTKRKILADQKARLAAEEEGVAIALSKPKMTPSTGKSAPKTDMSPEARIKARIAERQAIVDDSVGAAIDRITSIKGGKGGVPLSAYQRELNNINLVMGTKGAAGLKGQRITQTEIDGLQKQARKQLARHIEEDVFFLEDRVKEAMQRMDFAPVRKGSTAGEYNQTYRFKVEVPGVVPGVKKAQSLEVTHNLRDVAEEVTRWNYRKELGTLPLAPKGKSQLDELIVKIRDNHLSLKNVAKDAGKKKEITDITARDAAAEDVYRRVKKFVDQHKAADEKAVSFRRQTDYLDQNESVGQVLGTQVIAGRETRKQFFDAPVSKKGGEKGSYFRVIAEAARKVLYPRLPDSLGKASGKATPPKEGSLGEVLLSLTMSPTPPRALTSKITGQYSPLLSAKNLGKGEGKTQPIEYLRARSSGRYGKVEQAVKKRKGEEEVDSLARERAADSDEVFTPLQSLDKAGKARTPFEKALKDIKGRGSSGLDSESYKAGGMRLQGDAQRFDTNLPQGSSLDDVFASLTLAISGKGKLTPQNAVNDGISFSREVVRHFNATVLGIKNNSRGRDPKTGKVFYRDLTLEVPTPKYKKPAQKIVIPKEEIAKLRTLRFNVTDQNNIKVDLYNKLHKQGLSLTGLERRKKLIPAKDDARKEVAQLAKDYKKEVDRATGILNDLKASNLLPKNQKGQVIFDLGPKSKLSQEEKLLKLIEVLEARSRAGELNLAQQRALNSLERFQRSFQDLKEAEIALKAFELDTKRASMKLGSKKITSSN